MELFKLFGTIMVDNEKANKSISKTGQEADGLGTKFLKGVEKVGKWGLAVAGAAASAGAAIYGVANNAAATTDNIDKMSQKIGISRKAYQELDFICSQSGTSVDKLQTGLKTLTTAMDGAKKGTDANVKIFKKLKVSVTDSKGAFRSQEDVLWDTLSSLQKVENQTEKSRLATQLFGKTGLELMPLLNGAAGSIDEMKKQAHDLGLVLNDESIDAGVKLTDTMDQAKRSFDAITSKIGVSFMPIIQKALDYIIEHMPDIEKALNDVFDVFEYVVDKAQEVFEFLKPYVQDLIDKIKDVVDNLKNMKDYVTENSTLLKLLGVVVGTLTALFVAYQIQLNLGNIMLAVYTATTGAATAVTTAFGAAVGFLTSPIGVAIMIIGALIAVGVLLYENWDTICAYAGELKDKVVNAFNKVKEDVSTALSNVVNFCEDKWQDIKDFLYKPVKWVIDKFNKIKDDISKPFEDAANAIKDIWSSIKSAFKLPHFTLEGTLNPLKWIDKGMPKIGVEWYAKAMDDGMILDSPTIFGASNGKLLGGGEAGSETIVGTKSLMEMINNASNSGNSDLLNALIQIRDYLADEERWYRIMLRALTDGSFAIVLDGREVGRLVRKYA